MRYFFLFRKPRFERFEIERIVMQEMPHVLLAWKIRNGGWLRLRGLKGKLAGEGALLLKLPVDTKELGLTLGNLWRRRRQSISIISLEGGPETLSNLLHQRRPIQRLKTQSPRPRLPRFQINTRFARIKTQSPLPESTVPIPSIRIELLQPPLNVTAHE